LNEYFDEYAAALAAKYGESAAEQFRRKCVDFNLDVHNQYNQAAEAALSAAQHSSEVRQQVLGVLPAWGLPPFCHPDAAQRALLTFEQQLGEAHASASASAVQELTARCQGWAEWADFRERFDHVLGQMQRGVTVEVESRRAAASAAVRTVIQEAEMAHLQQERQQEWQAQRNPPVRDVRRKNTLANEAKEFDAQVQVQVQVKLEIESQRPPASQPKAAAGAQVKTEGATVGKKRKPDLAPGEFVGGAVSAVKEESVLERSKREAQAALQARLDSFGASKGRDKAKPRASSSVSSSVSSSSNGTGSISSRRVTREEEEAAAVAPDNEGMEQEEKEGNEVVPVKQEIKKRPAPSPGKRAKPSLAPKPKPAAVKAARTPVKAKPAPAAKRKQPVSPGDTLAGAKLAAAAELARRAEAYVPTVRGGNRANANTEDKQELQPDKKRARK